jgi:copper chaperone CopZ
VGPRLCFLGFAVFWAVQPGAAQIEKLAMRTTGISCGICAGLSEIYFRRLPGVDKVKISLRNEAILLTYKPGATVDPEAIRKVLEPLKVGVVQFQVSLRGEIRKTGGKQILQAGKDRFVVRDAIDSPVLPLNTPLHIEAILFDRVTPRDVKVLDFKPVP